MRTLYIALGGVVVAVACLGAGYWWGRQSILNSAFAGTVVAKDASSITLKMSDNSTRVVPIGTGTTFLIESPVMPITLGALPVGSAVQVNFDGGTAGIVIASPPKPAQ